MSQRTRLGVGGVVAGLAAAGAVLLNGPVWAANASSGEQLVFHGPGLLSISCEAKPDRPAVTLRAESTLRVVNHTGRRAQLLINGAVRGPLQDSQSAEVLFHRGTASLSLQPSCVVGDAPTTPPVQVTAVAAMDARTTSAPGPTAAPARPTVRPTRTPAGGSVPSTPPVAPSPEPGDGEGDPVTAPRGRPTTPAAPVPTVQVASPPPVAGTGTPVPTTTAVGSPPTTAAGPAAPTNVAAAPPVDPRRSVAPHDRRRPPAVVLPPRPAAAATDRVGRPAPPAAQRAEEPVVAMMPVHATSPFAMLVAVATICLLGVATALIRTIASERAFRAKVA